MARSKPAPADAVEQDATPTTPALDAAPSSEEAPSCDCTPETPHVLAPDDPLPEVGPDGREHHIEQLAVESDAGSTPVVDDESDAPKLDDPSLDSETPPPAEPPAPDAPKDAGAWEPMTDDEYPPDAPNEREPFVPTLQEYLDAGYPEGNYHKRFGKNPTPNTERAKREAEARAAIPTRSRLRGRGKFVVWEHGPMQRDGVLHQPGDVIEMSHAEAAGISCLSPAPSKPKSEE